MVSRSVTMRSPFAERSTEGNAPALVLSSAARRAWRGQRAGSGSSVGQANGLDHAGREARRDGEQRRAHRRHERVGHGGGAGGHRAT